MLRSAERVAADLVLEVADLDLIARPQLTLGHAFAVDADAVGAAEIADQEHIVLRNDAMRRETFFELS